MHLVPVAVHDMQVRQLPGRRLMGGRTGRTTSCPHEAVKDVLGNVHGSNAAHARLALLLLLEQLPLSAHAIQTCKTSREYSVYSSGL